MMKIKDGQQYQFKGETFPNILNNTIIRLKLHSGLKQSLEPDDNKVNLRLTVR